MKNIITTAINYTALTLEKSQDFEQFKHIEISESNPLMIKYIKQDKIKSLKEYQNIDFVNSKKQKNYLDETSIIKLLNKMFKAKSVEESQTINEVGEKINNLLRIDSVKDLQLFFYDDLVTFYNQENCELKTLQNGSCMEGKPKEYFEIYNNFIKTKVQIVGLRKGNSVIARAILWTKNQDDKKLYFLDRIYVASQYDNCLKEKLQSQLWAKVKRALRLKTLDCFSSHHIERYYEKKGILVKNNSFQPKEFSFKNYARFEIQITQDTFDSLQNYPYIDYFRYFKETTNNYKSCPEDESCIQLDQTDGDYSDTENREFCEYSQEYYDKDDCCWSDIDNCYYYQDNCRYIEERGDFVSIDDAIYNDYSGEYHYKDDLNI